MPIHGDCLDELKKLPDNSVDCVVTDPPYGYSFMGKSWDKALPSTDIWRECLRVLKPGGFAFIMSAPRSDVLSRMIVRIEDAGFRVDFTPIYWTYASGFPKAMNIGKAVDKRLGAKRKLLPNPKTKQQTASIGTTAYGDYNATTHIAPNPVTSEAKSLDGSYGGFQPKPAVEVIIVAMKPLSEKTYVDQALANGKGVTWLDAARIPLNGESTIRPTGSVSMGAAAGWANPNTRNVTGGSDSGRFPANLIVQDDVLNDYSKYFSLDEWFAAFKSKAYNTEICETQETAPNAASPLPITLPTEPEQLTGSALADATPSIASHAPNHAAKSAAENVASTEISTAPKSAPTKRDTVTSNATPATSESASITPTTPSEQTPSHLTDVNSVLTALENYSAIIQTWQNRLKSYGSVSPATTAQMLQEIDPAQLWPNFARLPERIRKTLPFIPCPKASKREKNAGLEDVYTLSNNTPSHIIKEIEYELRRISDTK